VEVVEVLRLQVEVARDEKMRVVKEEAQRALEVAEQVLELLQSSVVMEEALMGYLAREAEVGPVLDLGEEAVLLRVRDCQQKAEVRQTLSLPVSRHHSRVSLVVVVEAEDLDLQHSTKLAPYSVALEVGSRIFRLLQLEEVL
jgi:hypothetical protein